MKLKQGCTFSHKPPPHPGRVRGGVKCRNLNFYYIILGKAIERGEEKFVYLEWKIYTPDY